MAAASFASQKSRVNIKKIEKTQAIRQNIPGLYSQMCFEIGVEIRRAAAEKKNFAARVRANIVRKPLPVANAQVWRGHGAHERLKKPFMSFASFFAGSFLQLAHVPYEFRKIHG